MGVSSGFKHVFLQNIKYETVVNDSQEIWCELKCHSFPSSLISTGRIFIFFPIVLFCLTVKKFAILTFSELIFGITEQSQYSNDDEYMSSLILFEVVYKVEIFQLPSTCKINQNKTHYCCWSFCEFPEDPLEESILDELGLIDIFVQIFFELVWTFAKD